MAKREWLMLAHTYKPEKHSPAGWFMSEKMDGLRAMWDGGISRGIPVKDVPFANTEKDYRFLNQNILATGLWSRGAKVIHAPDWWLAKLPPFPVDGEIHAGRSNWQLTASIAKDIVPNEADWKKLRFEIIDVPAYETIFADGTIEFRSGNNVITKSLLGVDGWALEKAKALGLEIPQWGNVFEFVRAKLARLLQSNEVISVVQQIKLPYNTTLAREVLEQKLDEITTAGGEGIMLRKSESMWVPERCHHLLKVKKFLDSEGVVAGYVWGKATDRGSKLLGKMGCMRVKWNNKIFELSGFTDQEREMRFQTGGLADMIGRLNPGKEVAPEITNPMFPVGSKVTFRYRELSDGGIPKEARYWRKPFVLEAK